MNPRRCLAMFGAAVIATAALSSPVVAAGPGGGGGGEPPDTGSLYADLVIALRDVNGTPILKMYNVPATETEPATTEYCVQPISYERVPGIEPSTNPVDGRQVWVIPLQGEWLDDPEPPVALDEIGACDPQPQYAMFVSEVELERLNLTRTSDEVIAQKIADVQTKLRFADSIALESTGRIAWDDSVIDASPENAAIYQSLIKTGTIPGLHPSPTPPVPAAAPPGATGNSQFDAWELMAMAIGAAASKSTPVTIDTVEYYNRIIGMAEFTTVWDGLSFLQPLDPTTGSPLADSERFIDYSGFSYNRSETFKGSVTWLDVPSLKWKVTPITEIVPFTNLSSLDKIGTSTLYGVTAFAQLADDVRALCNFIPDNTFIPGFYMDVPGVDTTADQLKAIHDPAVDLGTLPGNVFETYPFQVTASLLNPWGGDQIPDALLRLTVDAPDNLAVGDLTATATDGQSVPFSLDGDGNLIGWWGPPIGFPVAPGYNISTTFDVLIADGAPTGVYNLTLDLVKASDHAIVLAQELGNLVVNANDAMVLWDGPVAKYATQGSAVTLPLTIYSPDTGTAQLSLIIAGPGDDPSTPQPEALAASDVRVYGDTGTDMVRMPLALDADGALVGSWQAPLTPGYNPVRWYATVADGALVGNYTFGVDLDGGNSLDAAVVAIAAPETHGQQPPGSGEDTTPPVVSITSATIDGTSATIEFIADDDGTTFECLLTADSAIVETGECTSPKAYTGLADGSYVFSVLGTNREGLESILAASVAFSIGGSPGDTTPPEVTITPIGVLGSTAQFTLTANEPGVTYSCSLTKGSRAGPWTPCSSSVEFTNLKPATYTLRVRGTDPAGNQSEPFSSESWTVSKGRR